MVAQGRLKQAIDIYHRLRKRRWCLLRQIVSDAAVFPVRGADGPRSCYPVQGQLYNAPPDAAATMFESLSAIPRSSSIMCSITP